MTSRRLSLPAAAIALVGATLVAPTVAAAGRPVPAPTGAEVLGFSVLPAETYVPGSEASGHWTTGNAAVPAPYPGQPVQGFSGTHRNADGSYLVLSDNGFGSKANSQDALLALHRIRPNTTTGETAYETTLFTFSDPHRLIPWQTWRDGGCAAAGSLPAGYSCPTADRQLTGWDFDPESLQVGTDGTFWVGEEFGPYLLHFDGQGELLEAPVATPGVKSPSNPTLGSATPDIANSKGFEGLAISPDGRTLYPMLEGSTADDKAAGLAADLRIYEAPIGKDGTASFTGDFRRYRMEDPANALGDFIAVNKHQFLVIERDNGQGPTAVFKRIYLVDTRGVADGGYVTKTLLVDLMNVPNPKGAGGFGDPFTFPFFTIEDVELVDDRTIAVMNDNNFPAAGGRSSTAPDENEFVLIRLASALQVDHRLL
ncbi:MULTISPECIES: esterase-like activity of phytase family protein [unclassified Knoellia]|uniref:esterase-like activity of phytase family protein n=1 Tax=Knoellia altitudinis TaxID=3404795 RepID=UPI00361483FA